ncbi:DUF475 domain-containing protein [Pseudooceanicola sp. CBS1P-1]|uniref:DUF475 domain-containing protein n=1 Tax=Pseudooceanicola albus TaxID=2692189 RepID=A0A6L7FZF7_9RHOB|nr:MULTISPECIES: DUF475 domain-containing protein [Pseudooceanicola]MBT9382652.1 DUF475 domain-containing protein [Pseudooceanicola endophyticus]MXN17191.1 DUF475 domain-containing protein [Pseudooceanicola albus]
MSSSLILPYFRWAFIVTLGGLCLGAAVGWIYEDSLSGLARALFICAVLAVLEISLSFDNAIVNANKLKGMTPAWQKRFLTWGIVIAVFGMRILFPLLIIVAAAHVGPWAALKMAATDPHAYAEVLHRAHLPIAAFGGTFLMMVALNYFCDTDKRDHWLCWLESRLSAAAAARGIEIVLVLALALAASRLLGPEEGPRFFRAAIWGLLTYLLVNGGSAFLDARLGEGTAGNVTGAVARGGLGAFLYLEMLDASFSFDGVIGAFALSHNIFIIAIGLGIGAMYVRSLTIMLVEREVLSEYRYLEHGAFYAILVLSLIMYAQVFVEVPEVITGCIGAGLIGLSFRASLRDRARAG